MILWLTRMYRSRNFPTLLARILKCHSNFREIKNIPTIQSVISLLGIYLGNFTFILKALSNIIHHNFIYN